MGKKDTCPVCHEKVDLRTIFADRPWETTNLNWNQMLDLVSLSFPSHNFSPPPFSHYPPCAESLPVGPVRMLGKPLVVASGFTSSLQLHPPPSFFSIWGDLKESLPPTTSMML